MIDHRTLCGAALGLALLSLPTLAACPANPAGHDAAPPSRADARPEGGGREGAAPQGCSGTPGTYQTATFDLPGCNGLGPGSDGCYARALWDPARCCPGRPCSKLIVYWSGGVMNCDDTTTADRHFDAGTLPEGGYVADTLLAQIANRGLVAVCAEPFKDSDEAAKYPFYQELERSNLVMKTVRAGLSQVWSGSKLIISGVSHGASTPLVLVARQRVLREHADLWSGHDATALVLFDGISNPASLDRWLGQKLSDGTDDGARCDTWHKRFVQRYGDGNLACKHACTNKVCYCATPAHASDWEKDVAVSTADLKLQAPPSCDLFSPPSGDVFYRFVSCGGGLKPCDRVGLLPCGGVDLTNSDTVPDEQQVTAYDMVKDCPGVKKASYQSYPSCPHLLCGAGMGANFANCGVPDSLQWLESQGF